MSAAIFYDTGVEGGVVVSTVSLGYKGLAADVKEGIVRRRYVSGRQWSALKEIYGLQCKKTHAMGTPGQS